MDAAAFTLTEKLVSGLAPQPVTKAVAACLDGIVREEK